MNIAASDSPGIAARYIELWNEADASRRTQLLRTHWSEGAVYADPLMRGQGHAQISELIGAVHRRYPGFRFRLVGTPDGHGDHVRFSWSLGPEGADELIQGTDFADLCEGRLARVTGFLDKVPAGA